MTWSFTIDQNAIALVRDEMLGKHIGTGFSFIQPNWFVTAKHVVMDYGEPRRHLTILANKSKSGSTDVQLLFAHPEVDLAVVESSIPICKRPLFPAHHALAGADGLVFAGYAPSKPQPNGMPSIYVNQIPRFEVQLRGRSNFEEETILFAAPDSEGGHSGGPIFGAGGGVVGAIIDHFHDGHQLIARGTSLVPLISSLGFCPGSRRK